MPFAGENKREKIAVLLTMCFALFMAMLDNMVVHVALPTLRRELNTGISGLQWIIDGYVLAFAGLLLTGGILGDRYGRKRAFMCGLAVFTLASLLCGLSGSEAQLIAARALQGVGAAMLMPGTLSILTVTFPPHERAQALGIWAGVSGIALALGPTLGGYMIQHFGWQSVFFLNVPIGIVALFVAWRIVRESVSEQLRRLDLVGLALGTGMLFTLTYGLIEANQRDWTDPVILGCLVASAIFLIAFLRWEHLSDHAMLPLGLFRIPAFSAGNYVAFSISLGMFGTFFFMGLYMQVVRGYSPLESGVRFLPMTLMIIVTAPNAGRITQRYGPRWPITVGLTLAGTGLLLLSRVSATTPWTLLFPIFVMLGVGMASVMAPMTSAVMGAVGSERAGLGSAMTNTSREVGGVFGIALLGALLTTKLKGSLTAALAGLSIGEPQRTAIIETAGHGRIDSGILADIPFEQLRAVRNAIDTSFLDGFHLALLVGASVLYVAAVIANRFIRAHPAGGDERPIPEQAVRTG